MALTRRQFAAGPFLIGMTAKAERRIEGRFVNDAFPLGHRIRDHASFMAPRQTRKVPLVIVGGGCAGLSAAWRLNKKGFRDFVLLEMEPEAGGNARWGENEVSRYPWAAHYLPVPNKESALVRELCEELGLLEDGKWNERYLCFSSQERLYMRHRWQDGLEPETGATARDREQYKRFGERMREFRATGQFTKPIDIGGLRTQRPSPLDAMSFEDWMNQELFDSSLLRWYANYSTRDDYGALARDTSAWAGIHEFASREPEEKGPLTWPEGNGWIVARLLERLKSHVQASSPVYAIRKNGRGWRVLTESTEYLAQAVIFAAPSFTAQYVIEGARPAAGFVYSPWLTANLTLDHWPRGEGYAWDNVFYDSPSLGYVVATHMSLATHQPRTVWTYYWALAEHSPQTARRELLDRDWGFWKEAILTDLERAHPDIRSCVSRIDIMRLGHAMARPAPGFLGSQTRKRLLQGEPNLFYANSDLSGLSIFEEAQYRGVTAADRALARLSGR